MLLRKKLGAEKLEPTSSCVQPVVHSQARFFLCSAQPAQSSSSSANCGSCRGSTSVLSARNLLLLKASTCGSTLLSFIVGFSSRSIATSPIPSYNLIDTKPNLDIMVLTQLSATQSRPLVQARRVSAVARRAVVARAQQRQNLAQIAGAAAAASLLLVRVACCLITV